MYTNIFGSKKLANTAILVFVIVIYSMCIASSLVQSTRLISSSLAESEHLVGLHHISHVHNKRDDGQPTKKDDKINANNGLKQITRSRNSSIASSKLTKVEENLNCSQLVNANKTECLKNVKNPPETKGDIITGDAKTVFEKMTENRGMLMRTLYVTLGVSGIVVVYFVARSCWLRRRQSKSRKYGVVKPRDNHRDMEMEPLGDGNDDDDDDDYTVFEANGRRK